MSRIKTINLDVGYDKKVVVENVEISVGRGEILCLIGPNGSGKSTILKTILNEIKALDGDIILSDLNIKDISINKRARKISAVLTNRVRAELTLAREIVELGRHPHTNFLGKLSEKDKIAVDKAIERVNAKNIENRFFNTLSDGEKQRILLARAIAQESDIMVLDEPTSFLDIRYKSDLLKILSDLAYEEGKMIILSLHEIALSSRIATKVALIKDGQIYKYGNTKEVVKDDFINEVYNLENGVFDSSTGNVEIIKETDPKKEKVFVLSSCDNSCDVYRRLNAAQIEFFAGVLFEGSLSIRSAKIYSSELVVNKAFVPISDENIERAKYLIDKSDYIINLCSNYNGINSRNKELFDYANKKLINIFNYDELNL